MAKIQGTAVELWIGGKLAGTGSLEFGVTVTDDDGHQTHYGPPHLWSPIVALECQYKPCYGNLWLKIAREEEFQAGLAELRNLINRFPPAEAP